MVREVGTFSSMFMCGFPAVSSSPLAKEALRVAFVDPKTLWEVMSSIGRRDADIGSRRGSLKGSERNSGRDAVDEKKVSPGFHRN